MRELNHRVPGDLNVDGIVTNAVAMQPFSPILGSTFGFGGTSTGTFGARADSTRGAASGSFGLNEGAMPTRLGRRMPHSMQQRTKK